MSDYRQDFEMNANRSKQVYFDLTDGGTPLDLTDATLTWRMGPQPSGEAVLQKTTQQGITIIGDPTLGQVMLSIGSADISDSGVYWHDLSYTLAGNTYTVAAGRVVVMPSVSPQT
jgi:hypothetical protein